MVIFRYLLGCALDAYVGLPVVRLREDDLKKTAESLIKCFENLTGLSTELALDPVVDDVISVACRIAIHLFR